MYVTTIKNKVLKRILWLLLVVAITITLISAVSVSNSALCSNVVVDITNKQASLFLSQTNIENIINAKDAVIGQALNKLDIKAIEQKLQSNVWIKEAQVYITNNKILHVTVTEREPLCRLFCTNGNSFYIDTSLNILPVSTVTNANVPVFTGYPYTSKSLYADTAYIQSIKKIAIYLTNNLFWQAQIQQVVVKANATFELIPTMGKHTIVLGDTTLLHQKMERLYLFYKTVLTKVGLSKYPILNLTYNNQIVATTNTTTAIIDTATANKTIQKLLTSDTLNETTKEASVIQVSDNEVLNKNSSKAIPKVVIKQVNKTPTPSTRTVIKNSSVKVEKKVNSKLTVPKPLLKTNASMKKNSSL